MNSLTASKVTSAKVADAYGEAVMKTYASAPVALVRGEGSYVWDAENRRYLDFTSGVAVNTLGHAHPYWTQKLAEQAARLSHCSNLFLVPDQARLAQRLCARAGEGRVFFCNSGAEANEGLLKLARLYGREKAQGQEGVCYKVVVAHNAFHGRTFGGMSATPQEKIQGGFRPLVPGFTVATLNDLAAFAAAIDEATCAVMLETIQGEGGVNVTTPEFLRELRALCDERGVLLLIDEVQCGIGRTGSFFAYEQAGIQPDALGMAKGLGGGFPIGALWARRGLDHLFTPGSHGTTFGGSPLACAAANAVLDVLEAEQLLERVTRQSAPWHSALRQLIAKHPARLKELRGRGYMVALAVAGDPGPWITRLRDNGLLTVRAGTDAIRLLPPLTASPAELEAAVEILDFVFGTTP